MTIDDFRHYAEVLHLKDADERGVRVQMKSLAAQFPPWWSASWTEEMTLSMLQVDFVAVDYSYAKSCASSAEIGALSAMFATPEGQTYAAKVTGGQVEGEANGLSPTVAREQVVDHDTGLPLAALDRLSTADRKLVVELMRHHAFDCMSSGFKKASVDITDERTKAARNVIAKHHDELMAAKEKYESSHSVVSK